MRRISLLLGLALAFPSSARALDCMATLGGVCQDMARYATMDAVAGAVSAAISQPNAKLSAVPTSGPGPGLCKVSVVPSDLITSGGVTGTPGTCSRIVQCGTSATYTVVQFNLGSGC